MAELGISDIEDTWTPPPQIRELEVSSKVLEDQRRISDILGMLFRDFHKPGFERHLEAFMDAFAQGSSKIAEPLAVLTDPDKVRDIIAYIHGIDFSEATEKVLLDEVATFTAGALWGVAMADLQHTQEPIE